VRNAARTTAVVLMLCADSMCEPSMKCAAEERGARRGRQGEGRALCAQRRAVTLTLSERAARRRRARSATGTARRRPGASAGAPLPTCTSCPRRPRGGWARRSRGPRSTGRSWRLRAAASGRAPALTPTLTPAPVRGRCAGHAAAPRSRRQRFVAGRMPGGCVRCWQWGCQRRARRPLAWPFGSTRRGLSSGLSTLGAC